MSVDKPFGYKGGSVWYRDHSPPPSPVRGWPDGAPGAVTRSGRDRAGGQGSRRQDGGKEPGAESPGPVSGIGVLLRALI